MHRPDESLDWTEKNIDMQMLRSFWPKLEKIRQVREALQKKQDFLGISEFKGGGVYLPSNF